MWMKTNAARVLFRASHGDITKIGGFARFSRGGKRCGGRGHAGMPVCRRACPRAARDARSCVSPLPDASVARPASR
ncbi:AraC family transcriptional regulator, partial [Burkholderia pseudomallei]|nr:AraC family transcriptional regulator [Burkholderia pseudomallei]